MLRFSRRGGIKLSGRILKNLEHTKARINACLAIGPIVVIAEWLCASEVSVQSVSAYGYKLREHPEKTGIMASQIRFRRRSKSET